MYQRINVVKSRGNAGSPASKEPNVTIVATDDILSWPTRDSKGVNIVGSFEMKLNARMITFYMTPMSIKANVESTGEQDAMAFMHKFEGEAPGDDLPLAEAVQNWAGVNCIIIYGSCKEGFRKVLGTECSPLQMKSSLQDDKDARKWKLSFEQFVAVPVLPGHYTGALSFGAPFAVADVSAVVANESNGFQYKLPSVAVSEAIVFDDVSLQHGTVLSLFGGGGVAPAILTTGVSDKKALLISGTDWIAYEGAVINLQVFNNGAITLLIELSRT